MYLTAAPAVFQLTRINFSSQNCRQTLLTSHLTNQVILVGSRLASTEKFGSKRTLSVGLHLTASSHIMSGPDVCVPPMYFGQLPKRYSRNLPAYGF